MHILEPRRLRKNLRTVTFFIKKAVLNSNFYRKSENKSFFFFEQRFLFPFMYIEYVNKP